MATRLKNIVRFVGVAAGATVALPHLLNVDDVVAVVPDFVDPSVQGFTITADSTNVTVTNNGVVAASVDVFVEYWHSLERVFGSTLQNALTPSPFVTGGPASGVSGLPYLGVSYDDTLSVDVYLDATLGNDANSGLIGFPLQTFKAFFQRYPYWLFGNAKLRLHLAGVGGVDPFDQPLTPADYYAQGFLFGGLNAYSSNLVIRGPQLCPFVPATGAYQAAVNAVTPTVRVLQNLVPDVAGERTKVDCSGVAPGWTVADFRGKAVYARIMRGVDMVIPETPITYNGADYVVLDIAIAPGEVVNGDVLEIVRHSVELDGPPFDGFPPPGFLSIMGGPCALSSDGWVTGGQGAGFERVRFKGRPILRGATIAFDRCAFATSISIYGGVVDMLNCVAMGDVLIGAGANVNGTYMFPRSDTPTSPLPANLFVDRLLNSIVVFDARITVGHPSDGVANLFAWYTLAVYDSPSMGLFVYGGSRFSHRNTSTAACMGDGNITVGILCREGGQALVGGGKKTEITGGGGALQVGTGAAIAYGLGLGAFEEVAGFAGNFHRVGGSSATVPLGDLSRIAVTV
jgi:hypothetical protein